MIISYHENGISSRENLIFVSERKDAAEKHFSPSFIKIHNLIIDNYVFK